MSNIINFTEAQTKKLKKEKMLFESLKVLLLKLQDQTSENSTKIIHTFLESFREDDKFLTLTIKLITADNDLKTPAEKVVRALTYEDREQLLTALAEIWPKEIDTVNRLKHILKLSHFCSRQVPRLPFFQIIPRSIVMKFLLAEKNQ